MTLNGAGATAISPSGNHAGVGGLENDIYDMKVTRIEWRQDAFIDAPNAPNMYIDDYPEVDYMGYAHPVYSIGGSFDEMAAEQHLTADASGSTLTVAEAEKFGIVASQPVYVWDSASTGETAVVSSVSGKTITLTGSLSGSYTVANDARVRARDVVGRRILQYFLEEDTEKKFIHPMFAPNGIVVHVKNATVTSAAESLAPTRQALTSGELSNEDKWPEDVGAIMSYSMTLVITPESVS
jgi:hypothetical protein